MRLSSIADALCPTSLRPLLNRLEQSPLGKRIVSGTFWLVVGSGAAKAFGFLALLLTARILESKAFGEFELVRSTANMFLVFAMFGMGTTATKYVAEYLATDKERVGRIISLSYLFTTVVGGFISLLFYLFTPLLCEHVVQTPHLVREMQFGAVVLFLAAFLTNQMWMIGGFQDFRGMAWAELIAGFFKIPLYVGGAYFWGLKGVIVTFGLSLIVNIVLNVWIIGLNKRQYGIRNSYNSVLGELPVLWKFSLPSTLAGIITMPALWICGVLLIRHYDGDTTEFGVYTAALQIQLLLMYCPAMLVKVMLPMMCEAYGQKNWNRFRKLIVTNGVANIGTTVLISLPFCLFSGTVMGFYGSGFTSGGNILIVFCLAAVTAGPDLVLTQVLTSQGRMWSVFGLNVIWVTALLTTTILFLSLGYGGVALALGHLAAYLLRILTAVLYMVFYRQSNPLLSSLKNE